jgi:DNA-binding winged helix-turn-helix (wHTH) protein
MHAFVFEPFALDPAKRRLTKGGEPLAVSERQLDVLLRLVAHAGQVVAKDDLIAAAWKDVAVADNSLEQAISALRRTLGPHPSGATYIETIPRRGYRFGVAVERKAARETDEGLEALLAPHRAFVEGRAALETLEAGQVARALDVFERAIAAVPEYASAHVGLANACVLRYEMTRADPLPDHTALERAARHAREACRLNPQSAEAWATLGFIAARTGSRVDALAASNRAIALEPDNWRHHFRVAYVSWGEERLRAAHRTLALLPEFPLAHWLAATVYVARQLPDEAARELEAGLANDRVRATFGAVALNWLRGLIHLSRNEHDAAMAAFERELEAEGSGHLYARECCANTWYAIGVLRRRQGRSSEAAAAFRQAVERIPAHPLARLAIDDSPAPLTDITDRPDDVDAAMARAVALCGQGAHTEAANIVTVALSTAPPGAAGWLLPLEPTLHVTARPEIWRNALAHLTRRAA